MWNGAQARAAGDTFDTSYGGDFNDHWWPAILTAQQNSTTHNVYIRNSNRRSFARDAWTTGTPAPVGALTIGGDPIGVDILCQ